MVHVELSSARSLSNLLLYPHILPEALPSSPDVGVICGPYLNLLSHIVICLLAPFPHSHLTGWLSQSPDQPSCSAPDCGSYHILLKQSSDHAAALLKTCSSSSFLPVTEKRLEDSQLGVQSH